MEEPVKLLRILHPLHSIGQQLYGAIVREVFSPTAKALRSPTVRQPLTIRVTPVNWYQVSSPLKLMMDRLVCADGGNADPTRTHGKDAAKAKELELAGPNPLSALYILTEPTHSDTPTPGCRGEEERGAERPAGVLVT